MGACRKGGPQHGDALVRSAGKTARIAHPGRDGLKRLITALDRWSEGKPRALVWIVAAALCWLLLAVLIALPFAVPAFGGQSGRDAGRGCARISEAQARQVHRLVEAWTDAPPAAEAERVYFREQAFSLLRTTRPSRAVGATLRLPDGADGRRIVVVLPCRERVDAELLAVLAHERVHVLQHHAGAAWPPPEAPAERVQRRYLEHSRGLAARRGAALASRSAAGR